MKTSINAAKTPLKQSFYYGWVVIVIAAVCNFFSGPGQTYFISGFIDSYIGHFNWSRSLVSGVYSGGTLAAGLLLFLVGRMIDRYGHRVMTVIIGALLGAACLWSSFIISPVMLFFSFFLLRFLGQGSLTLLPSTLVPQWFIKRRAFALCLATLGGVAGSALLPHLNIWMIQNWNWSVAWRVWTVMLWVIFLPLAYVFIRNKPEDMGLLPDNKVSKTTGENVCDETEEDDGEVSWTLAEAIRTRAFWLMMFCQSVPAMIITGLTFHIVSILGEGGIPPEQYSFVISTRAVVSFGITFVAGYVMDRIKFHYITAFMLFIEVIGMVVLLLVESLVTGILFGILDGILLGFQIVWMSAIWPNYFGRKHLGTIRGFAMTSCVIASALGPLPFGAAYDFFGGYKEIIIIMGVFPLIGVFAALISPKPVKSQT